MRQWIHPRKRVLIAIFIALTITGGVQSQTLPPATPPKSMAGDLTQMSIEDLMNLEVTSGSKKEESVQRTAAAIFVITSEDIRRSGATTLPDVLRMAPGLDVAQINGNVWAVSSRGFNDAFANKMLVLVDGRTVYSPVFSGVFWSAQDMMLADIERIEVISGPGAALWGMNAVNGVINIITKATEKTQGTTVTAASGNVEGGYGAAQFGAPIKTKGFFRVFAKGFSKTSVAGAPGQASQYGWNLQHGGFRADWVLNLRDTLTVEGNLFRSSGEGSTTFTTSLAPLTFGSVPDVLTTSGGNILARWRRIYSTRSEINLQVYYDEKTADAGFIRGAADTVEVELQHRFAIGERNDIVWGVDYRVIEIKTNGGIPVSFTPPRITENLASGFLQDEIQLMPGRVRLTLGGRIQRDYSTEFSFQPDARLLWTPSARQSVWFAASRALRGVSPADTSVHAFLGPVSSGAGLLVIPEVLGNPNMRSEAEVTFQMGYRAQLNSKFSFSTTTYYNKYTRLRGQDAGTPIFETGSVTPFLLLPETANNKINGQTHGIEFFGNWKPISAWKLSGGYTWFDGVLRDGSTGAPSNTTAAVLRSPHHQFSVRSSVDFPHRIEFDTALYRVGPLDATTIPGYYRLDVRLGWRVWKHAELAVVGQNLLAPRHVEFESESDWFSAVPIRRSYYAKITWSFSGNSEK